MHHIPGFILQPISPLLQDYFKLDYTQIGWLTSAYSIAYGAGNLPAGWLGGRISPRILITVGVAGVAVCGLIAGIAPSYMILVITLIMMGILGGGYHPSAAPLISDATPAGKRAQALGFHQIGGTAANMAVPLLVAALLTFLSWRSIFIVMTVPTIMYGIYLYILLKQRKLGESPKLTHVVDSINITNPPGYIRRIIAFVIMGTVVQVFVYSAMTFIPLVVTDSFFEQPWLGAVVLATGHVAGFLAGPLGGYLADKFGKIPVMLTVSLAAGPLVWLLGMVSQWWILPIIMLVMGACMYVAMPITESYVISNISSRHRSTILGFYYFASRGGVGIVSPIIGNLIDRHSFGMAFTVTGLSLFVITLICSFLLWGNKDKSFQSIKQ
jgi:predicted MFS family arabinose efflux permease